MLFSISFLVTALAGVLGWIDGNGMDYFDSVEFYLYTYGISSLITFIVGFSFWLVGRKKKPEDLELLEREGFAVVGLAWLLVAAFGAVPYMLAGELDPLDAYFESMSGFTTTGATMLGADEVFGEEWNTSITIESMENKVFHGTNFTNASFADLDLYNVYFDQCSFENTSFRNVQFDDCWFINCTFSNSTYYNFTYANSMYYNSTFSNSTYANSSYYNSTYYNATINPEDRSPRQFFTDADFTDGSSDKWKEVYYPWPKSLLFWRSFTQWLGGMGIVVLTIVILSRFMGSSIQLLKVELPGLTMARLKPKIAQTAAIFWKIYLLFTIIEILLLWRFNFIEGVPIVEGGMPLYDAVGNSFTCLSSGGFSPRAYNIEAYDNAVYEAIFITFMVIAGTNFVLHFHALHGNWRKLVEDSEFRTFIGIMLLATLIITVKLSFDDLYSPLLSFRYALFQVVSLNTATGYSSTGYGIWPECTRFLLVILMVIGGSAGSTSGGMKVIRLIVLMKIAKREISRTIHPQREMAITVGGRTLPENLVQAVSTYFFVYLVILVISSSIIMFTGENLMDSVSSTATAMGGVGPPAGTQGPYFAFSAMNPLSKIVLILCMWLGRIEILAGFILFAPWSYKE